MNLVPKVSWKIWVFDSAVFIVLAFFLVSARWGSINSLSAINPDEAQFGANALRVISNGFGWASSDTGSSGPLNVLPLLLPTLFGFEPSLVSGRIVAALLIAISLFLTYVVSQIWTGRIVALCLVLAPLMVFGFTSSADLIHYSSELFPVAIYMLAIFFLIKFANMQHENRMQVYLIGAVGILVGSVPFAKLQATPIAVVIGMMALAHILFFHRKLRLPLTLSLISGTLVVPMLLLAPLAVIGQLEQFTTAYIGNANDYVGGSLTSDGFFALINHDSWFLMLFLGVLILGSFFLLGFLALSSIKFRVSLSRVHLFALFTFVFVLFA